MTVLLLAANGRSLTVKVAKGMTDNRACAVALKQAEAQYPAEGWRALHVL